MSDALAILAAQILILCEHGLHRILEPRERSALPAEGGPVETRRRRGLGAQEESPGGKKSNEQHDERAGKQDETIAFSNRLQAFAQILDVAPQGQLSTAGEPGPTGECT